MVQKQGYLHFLQSTLVFLTMLPQEGNHIKTILVTLMRRVENHQGKRNSYKKNEIEISFAFQFEFHKVYQMVAIRLWIQHLYRASGQMDKRSLVFIFIPFRTYSNGIS